MVGIFKSQGGLAVTPHKVSVCILLQIYAPPAQISVPFPFSSVAQHNRLGLFLLALTKSCDDILEPKLEELINQLREVGGLLDHWLIDHLTSRLSSLASPDDLFNFFSEMRGIVGGLDSGVLEDDQIILDPNSNLGMFLRRCVLAFNVLSFEGVCHLLTNIGMYCKETISSCSYGASELDDTRNDLETLPTLPEYENMDLESLVFEKVDEEIEARKRKTQSISFHFHMPEALSGLVEDVDVPSYPKCKSNSQAKEAYSYSHSLSNTSRDIDPNGGTFLRTNWQIQGYLDAQAETIEKLGSLFSLNAFELVLKQLQKMAPELHRVHFLRYLNTLYHDDYFAASDNIHRYFDYSAGTEGFDFVAPVSGCNNFGRFEIALLFLGMMHVHFGHPKQALEVLTEAVHVSQQQSNDTCLAYTLTAIGNLLSEIGFSRTSGILGSSYSPLMSMGISLSVQQQLFVLLTESLRRAESLKLKRLVASNHLAMAKFHLMHVQRPLLSFGPRASAKLRTSPISVCKELRLSTHLICQYGTESSTKMTDGFLSTAWLKNLQKSTGSHVLFRDNGSGNNSSELPFFAQPASIPGSVLQLLGSSYLLRATAFEIYGSAPLARINALLYATCFADTSSSSDASLAYVKLIQHLAVFKGYKEAFSALKVAEERFLSLSKSRILLLKLQLVHEHALHRGCLKLARQACNELGVLASSVTGVDLELKTEASFRYARTLLSANQFSEAAHVAHSLFCMCYKYNLQVQNASVLLLLAEIHKKSGNAVLGLPYALASLSFCQSFNLDLLKASATLTIAELWLSLGPSHSKRALNLLHGAFPMILGHGGLELRARAFIAEAKCYLCSPRFSVSEDPEVVLDPLKQASEELQLLEYHEMAAEAFYLMAMVFDKLGRLEEREEAAASFKKHIMALENPEEGQSSLPNIL
ncbi:anaphase-promoting complex subunit 5 [Momordica charantia]|uniref:Anaphase-promoting complex subunit 5 n=1 Tax=Momordica charantia TaxID=3673 RepID=A0A6J1CMI3_MOMCH|nr:anaphase-promoting complex subunit 5 [Momordica charantia]XP_022142794.1 anaphase-promoting complex subunit 5 [Momordica charantia]